MEREVIITLIITRGSCAMRLVPIVNVTPSSGESTSRKTNEFEAIPRICGDLKGGQFNKCPRIIVAGRSDPARNNLIENVRSPTYTAISAT